MSDAAVRDPTAPLTATGNLRRRAAVSRAAEVGATASALIAVGLLGLMIYTVADRGGSAISFDFLTKGPPLIPGPGGGIAPAIIGTAIIVGVATLIAAPLGILIAIYLTEFARPAPARVIRMALDLMNGLPTIVIGVFVFGLIVVAQHHESGFAGSIALAIIMLPLIARSSQEVLLLVPTSLREAAAALGVSRWRSILTVVLPTALGGIATGTILAVARAAGETAPLLVVSGLFPNTVSTDLFGHNSQGLPNIPVMIFQLSEQADASSFSRAWGAAFVLLAFILLANVLARLLLAHSRSRLGQ
jgi:phosphate transport system permease protein